MFGARRYRKKPEIVEAMQYTGQNDIECYSWATSAPEGPLAAAVTRCFVPFEHEEIREILNRATIERLRAQGCTAVLWVAADLRWAGVEPGCWIARDARGFCLFSNSTFNEVYQPVDADC